MKFKRNILSEENTKTSSKSLQESLINLVDLSLLLKQAHWNVVGLNFRSVHIQLDEIIVTTSNGSDEIAERLVTLGLAADGRSSTVAKESSLEDFPEDFNDIKTTINLVANAVMTTIEIIRKGIEEVGKVDPISEDLLIGTSAALEKHLWMLQAQEV